MSNKDSKYKTVFSALESTVDELSVLLLTKQEIKEEQKKDLYGKLNEIHHLLESDKVIPKELASLLFNFYILAQADLSFNEDKSSLFFIGYLQEYMEKIFGEQV